MGILVFVLIFIPESNDGSSMHLLRAESPGPQVGKLVSKMKVTARILYLIYLGMTVLEVIILMLDEPIPGYESEQFFFSLLATFGCAGTGGFGFIPGSFELFHPFSQYVMSIFLILFGCNFSLYYLLLIGKIKDVLRSEEVRAYFAIIAAAVGFVFISLVGRFEAFPQVYTTEEAFRHSLFQVASLMTTAGYTTTDYHVWPQLATTTLVVVMFIGAMAGSTAGGIKVSRIVIAMKGAYINVRKLINLTRVAMKKCEELKMADWIIPCNPKYYDVVGAFSNLSRINWKQSAKNIDVNDIVYIYVGRPLMAIKFKCKVNKVNLDAIEIDDGEFIIIGDNYMNYKNHMELELLTKYEDELTLDKLRTHGLNGNVQGPRRLVGKLKAFVETVKA